MIRFALRFAATAASVALDVVLAASASAAPADAAMYGQHVRDCAQAMGFADIGDPYWDEEGYDYSNSQGIAVGKISGFLNPQFMSPVTGAVENHGMLSCYVAQ